MEREFIMKKVLKILAGLFIVGTILIVGTVMFILSSVDKFAKLAIEEGGTYALGVETTVDKADIQLFAKAFEMEGLVVANPTGFDSHFLNLGSAGVILDSNSLQSDVIELPLLTLSDLNLNLLKNNEGSNYQIILDNLKKFEAEDTDPAPSDEPADTSPKMVIRVLEINNVSVRMELVPLGGDLTAIDVELDKIELKDIGSGGKPVAAGDLISIIVKGVISAAINKGGDLIPGEMLGELQNGLADLNSLGDAGITIMTEVGGQLTDITGDITDQLGENLNKAAEDLSKDAEKALEDVTKGIGDVLKNPFDKKDKDDGG